MGDLSKVIDFMILVTLSIIAYTFIFRKYSEDKDGYYFIMMVLLNKAAWYYFFSQVSLV